MDQFSTYNLHNQLAVYCIIGAALILFGCQSGERQTDEASDPEIPERIDTLQNLTVFSPDEQTPDTVELVRDQTYGKSDKVFIRYMSQFDIDNRGRVYIAEGGHGRHAIQVFNADGSYLTTVGREGRGPGEFLGIRTLEIRDNRLYVYDAQRKISVFSLDDFSLVEEELLKRDKVKQNEELARLSPGGDLYLRGGGSFIMDFKINVFSNDHRRILYYKISEGGQILPDPILELKRFRYYIPDRTRTPEGIIWSRPMPFTRSSLIAVSDDGHIYTAWTEDFLIKVYDQEGNYLRAFYYPYKKSPLVVSDLELDSGQRELIDGKETPDTWPALHNIIIDDQNRLWVATITNDSENFQWWVLNNKGELLGKFKFPGKRINRSVTLKPDNRIVKNGYLYNEVRDEETGQKLVVRYQIKMN